jgi:5S rRNA maturation endonuclease (ribonuclease M5)
MADSYKDENFDTDPEMLRLRWEMLLKPNRKIYILRKPGLTLSEGETVPVFPSREYVIVNSIDGMEEFDDSSYLWKVYFSCVNRTISLEEGDLICIRRDLDTSCYVFTDIDREDESLDQMDIMNYFHYLDGYLDGERKELFDNARDKGEIIDIEELRAFKVKSEVNFLKDCFFALSEDKRQGYNGAFSNILCSFHFFYLSPSSSEISELNDNNNGAAYQSFSLVYSIFNKIKRDTPDVRCFLMNSIDDLLYLSRVRGDVQMYEVS